MIDVEVKFNEKQQKRIDDAIERAKAGSLSSAAYLVRETSIALIKTSKKLRGRFWKKTRSGKRVLAKYYEPSPPGKPVLAHRKGKWFFRRGIRYVVDKQREDAEIGFTYSQFEEIMSVHEHGGTEDGRSYPERPVVQPALERNIERFHRDWRSSIG